VNTSDEWLDDTEFYRGTRSLALRRDDSDNGATGTDLEKHLPCDPEKRHSFAGYMKADNAADAVVMARFYDGRSSGSPISSTDIGPRFTGSQDWFHQWMDLDTPGDADYFEVRCSNDAPNNGTGYAWFDELAFIEWGPWVDGGAPVSVGSPNNYRFVQIRTPNPGVASVTVAYEETDYDKAPVVAAGGTRVVDAGSLVRNAPNPFSPRTRITLWVPAGDRPVPATLAVYDVRGRKVATLFDGILPGGIRRDFMWDGRDASGHRLSSGVYFSRATVGSETHSGKMLLIR